MTVRVLALAWMLLLLVGVTIALLWAQTGMVSLPDASPWDPEVALMPTVSAVWLPAVYGFFSALWCYLCHKDPAAFRNSALGDVMSYFAIFPFFAIQLIHHALPDPLMILKSWVFLVLLLKCFLLFRALCRAQRSLHPTVLLVITTGAYLLSIPFTQLSPGMSLRDLLSSTALMHLGILAAKSLCQAVMMTEMYRLSVSMISSTRGALFGWWGVAFSFPLLGFPKISFLLAGTLFIFVLRLVISRLDTKELITGLLDPTSLNLGIKFVVFLAILVAGGLIFWSNVKPGFEIHGERAYEAAIATLFDGQSGIFTFSPLHWLALCGIIYLLYFRVWDGILLIATTGALFGGYHFINYGMFERGNHLYNSVPFLPFFGIFIAVAYHRFERFALFRGGAYLLAVLTCLMTGFLLLAFPELSTAAGKFGELHRLIIYVTGRDISSAFLSMSFLRTSALFWGVIGVMTLASVNWCYARTRAFLAWHPRRPAPADRRRKLAGDMRPAMLMMFVLMVSAILLSVVPRLHLLPLREPIQFTKESSYYVMPLSGSRLAGVASSGLLIVSSLTNSFALPQNSPLMNITIRAVDQHFETFTLEAGRDSAEEIADHQDLRDNLAHDRAAIFHSWPLKTDAGAAYDGHEYYARFAFKKPLTLEEIKLKVYAAKDVELPPGVRIHIKQMFLLE